MRIISGTYKGKKIFFPNDKITRPLKDAVRESIFNILQHSKNFKIQIANSTILDLFSGCGSFGIECISRGAEKVYFLENYKNVLDILKKNIQTVKIVEKTSVIEKDLYSFEALDKIKDKIDLVFLDPPFRDDDLDTVFRNIIKSDLLKEDHLLIIHRHKKTYDDVFNNFKILEKKIYGNSKIIFFKIPQKKS